MHPNVRLLNPNRKATSALVLTCFHLTKGRATYFRPKTIVASFLHFMVCNPKCYSIILENVSLWCFINLLRTAGRFIDQRRKEQGRIVLIRIANKVVTLMQILVKSTHWLLLKKETIPTKGLINRNEDTDIFFCNYMHLLSERHCPEKVNEILFNEVKINSTPKRKLVK